LKAEDREEAPAIIVTISDSSGRPIRRFTAPAKAGINRVAWDLRLTPPNPVVGPAYTPDLDFPFGSPPLAPYVVPGTYLVSLAKREDGRVTQLTQPQPFAVVGIDGPGARTMATLAQQQQTAELNRQVLGLSRVINETLDRLTMFRRAIDETPAADVTLQRRVRELSTKLTDAREVLAGDPTQARRSEPTPVSLLGRIGGAIGNNWGQTLEAPNASQLAELELVRSKFGAILGQVKQLIDVDLERLEADAERAGVPWTSGRFPSPPGQ
jgi:hypothetical protein